MDEKLKQEYMHNRAVRNNGTHPVCMLPAAQCLKISRRHLAGEKVSRAVSPARDASLTAQPWEAAGDSWIWVENPQAAGIRFIGFADEIARHIQHHGWYTHHDTADGDVKHGAVYLMRYKGESFFVMGIPDMINGSGRECDPAQICISDFTNRNLAEYENASEESAAYDCAVNADQAAERMAEQEREYNTAWEAGSRFASLREEVKELRESIISLCREARQARKQTSAVRSFPAICAAIRADVSRALDDIREAREEMSKLASGDYVGEYFPGFYIGDDRLAAAFQEGAESF